MERSPLVRDLPRALGSTVTALNHLVWSRWLKLAIKAAIRFVIRFYPILSCPIPIVVDDRN